LNEGEDEKTPMLPSQPINDIASAYDRWSGTYETVENGTRDLAALVLREELPDLRDREILEIGCGTGLNTRYLVERSRSVLGVDFSAGMLEQARANVTIASVRFAQWDIRSAWDLVDASVDLVVCMLVLEHIEDLKPLFGEASRVLRPGGEFFICELHPFRQLQGRQAEFTDAASGRTVLVPAFQHDVSDYVNTSVEHGFELLRMGEWRDQQDTAIAAPPRLLSLHVRIPH
jgi:malonyl-CoA O-methyltransferase